MSFSYHRNERQKNLEEIYLFFFCNLDGRPSFTLFAFSAELCLLAQLLLVIE